MTQSTKQTMTAKVTVKDNVVTFNEAMAYLSCNHLPKSRIEKLIERVDAAVSRAAEL